MTASTKTNSPKPTKASKPNAKTVRGIQVEGAARKALATKVVKLRDDAKALNSWGRVARAAGVSARSARKLYDEVKGAGAHYGNLPGKGGRTPAAKKVAAAKRTATKRTTTKAASK